MTALTRMFTVVSPDEYDDGECELLFYVGEGGFTEADRVGIMNAPRAKEIMGGCGLLVLVNWGDKGEEMLLTRDVGTHAMQQMNNASDTDVLMCMTPSAGLETVSLKDEYYNCKLPHRTILGCTHCLDQQVSVSCKIRSLSGTILEGKDEYAPGKAVEELKSRKTVIAGFTYVSPVLTTEEHFTTTYRSVNDHDFTAVEDKSEMVRQGLRERGRARHFIKNACSICMVKDVCGYEHNKKNCSGPILGTEADATKKILAENHIPFTNKQLMFLALNSGQLDNRINRCMYWATFRHDYHQGLTFGLCRYTTGYYKPFESFKEAESVLRDKLKRVREVQKGEKLSPAMKAILLELSKRSCSPNYCSGWGQTSYDTLGIEYNRYAPEWELRFKYNGNGYGGMLLPWSVRANKLADVYAKYGCIYLLDKSVHPDSYNEVHKMKYRY